MIYAKNWRSVSRLLLVSGLLLNVAACAKSPSESQALLPELDSEVKNPCRDPGVGIDPQLDALNHRLALAECEGRRELAAAAYERARKGGLE